MSNDRNELKRALIELSNRHDGGASIATDDAFLVTALASACKVAAPAFREPHLPFEKHDALLAAIKTILESAGVPGIRDATNEAVVALLQKW